MGTRADFYVGHGMEWLGSITHDGYEIDDVGDAPTEREFRARVAALIARNNGITGERGWPWSWRDSRLTDYAYVFVRGKGVVFRVGDDYCMDRDNFQTDDGKCRRYLSKVLMDKTDYGDFERKYGDYADVKYEEAISVSGVSYIYPDFGWK